MNAVEMLGHLVDRGQARHLAARAGTAGMIASSGFEVAVTVDHSERSMRARWRERVRNTPLSYLLVADDPARSRWLRVLGPVSVEAPIRSVEASALARVIADAAGMSALEGVRYLAEEIIRLAGEGLFMDGLLSRHTERCVSRATRCGGLARPR